MSNNILKQWISKLSLFLIFSGITKAEFHNLKIDKEQLKK